jgi:hypothetical protein
MATRRRSRSKWTAYKNGQVTTIDVLAYGESNALAILHANGYTSCQRITTKARAHNSASAATWAKNERAIREAIAFLGIKRPVTIKLTGRRGGRRGAYRPSTDATGHHITIKNYLTPEQAGMTLWHELCHAMQFEREVGDQVGGGALIRWNSADDHKGSYLNRPIEIEARSYEAHNAELPLARAR